MQPSGTSIPTQIDFQNKMQPQSTSNMYVSSTGNNNTSNVRANQQTSTLFRGPSTNPAAQQRSGARHIAMPTMFPQTMHQGVVIPPYAQYPSRPQQFQPAQYSFSQHSIQTPATYYSYPIFQHIPQQTQQRGAVGVNTAVGNTMPVQPVPNVPMAGPPGTTQTQISLQTGTMLPGAVPPGTNAVLGVTTSTGATGQQVGVTSIVGVVPQQTISTTSTKAKLRPHALKIIHPETKKNILDDLNFPKDSTNTEIDYHDQLASTTPLANMQPPLIQPSEILIATQQEQKQSQGVQSCGSVIVMTADTRTNLQPYNKDVHQMTPREAIIGQTPIVSAISDAPSVEIRPTPTQKNRSKKILPIVPPTEEQNETSVPNQPFESTATTPDITSDNNAGATIIDRSCNISKDNTTKTSVSEQISDVNASNQQEQQTKEVITANTSRVTTNTTIVNNSSHSTCSLSTDSLAIDTVKDIKTESDLQTDNNRLQQQQLSMQLNKRHNVVARKSDNSETTAPSTTAAKCGVASENEVEIVNIVHAQTATNIDTIGDDEHVLNISNSTTVAVEKSYDVTDRVSAIGNILPLSETENESNIKQTKYDDSNGVTTETKNTNNHDISNISNDNLNANGTVLTPTLTTASTSSAIETATAATKAAVANTTTTSSSAAISVIVNSNNQQEQQAQLLINYNEGQWSPNNPTGKKQYDRDQLLKLRDAKASRITPEVNNDSILPSFMPNLMPSFARINNKHAQSIVGAIGGGGNRCGGGGIDGISSRNDGKYISKQSSMSGVHDHNNSHKDVIRVNLSLNQDVKLNETDNAWRPRVLVKNGEGENDPNIKTKREKDELIRRVRGILNKLTPEKFDALVEEIIKLKIDTPDKMENVMVLVFEKAIDEPNFSVSYARLCHRLITEVKARDERMESGTKTNLAHFRNALLDKTEREFTQNVTQSSAKEKKLQPIIDKIKECADPIEKSELEALLEEEERKIRRRSGGTVRFIGELFKISMLTGKIINSCIETLLKPNSEDMLECLCKLLTTVGAKFEQTLMNAKEPKTCYSLNKTIACMQAIASKTDKEGSKVSSRVRFMLQDVIDLRKNKWQSTRNEAPKTMEQIEKETKTEQMSSHYLNYGGGSSGGNIGANGSSLVGANSKRDDRSGGRGGDGGRFNDARSSGGYSGSHSQRGGESGSLRRQQQSGGGNSSGNSNSGGGHANGNDDSTWHVQTGKGRSQAVDTNKFNFSLQDIDTKKLGGMSQFNWNNNIMRQSSSTATTPSNSFAALSALVDSNRNNDRERANGSRNKGSYSKGSMERDRYDRDRNMQSRGGSSSQTSRENSSSRNTQQIRSMMNSSSMQKSASHKYSQQMPSSRMQVKLSSISAGISGSSNLYNRGDQNNTTPFPSQPAQTSSTNLSASPLNPCSLPSTAVFEKPSDEDINIIKSVVTEMIESAANSKTINLTTISCFGRIAENQRCSFLYYILTDYLHLSNVGPIHRRYLANIVALLMQYKYLSIEHLKLSYKHFCEVANDLIVDIPKLWQYIFQFTGPLIVKKIINPKDLWNEELREENLGSKFLKTYLSYCTHEIGPSFSRNMWKQYNLQWNDFVSENEVQRFISSNKFEYIEDDSIQPQIDPPKETTINRVVEHIDVLLNEGSTADDIIDFINGNIIDIDKQYIRGLTTTLCNFAIIYKEGIYKKEATKFQKICIPVLQRYIDSKKERELECLYAMQLLVHSLEHPRGLLNELFVELYDADVIPQDSFIKWRDSKDQSAGKGVAVKGLNPFFNQVLSGETSDENN